jgi:hypothetical protein
MAGMTWANLVDPGNGMISVLVILFGEWFLFMAAAWYLEQVFASGTGNRKHPLFILDWLRQDAKAAVNARLNAQAANAAPAADEPEDVAEGGWSGAGGGAVEGGSSREPRASDAGPPRPRAPPASRSARPTLLPPFGPPPRTRARQGPDRLRGQPHHREGPQEDLPGAGRTAAQGGGRGRGGAGQAAGFGVGTGCLPCRCVRAVAPAPQADRPAALVLRAPPLQLAVRQLNLAIEKGECFGLLGPNGAGKSTSINMMVREGAEAGRRRRPQALGTLWVTGTARAPRPLPRPALAPRPGPLSTPSPPPLPPTTAP